MMRTSLFLVLVATLVPALHCQVKDAIIHEPVTLPCFFNDSSQNATWSKFLNEKFVSIKIGEKTSRVAFLGDTSKGNYSIIFSRTVYNDSGFYRCSCDLQYDIKLQVLVPLVITAFVGENISLPCYGQGVNDVTWKKDGQVVWSYSPKKKENVSDGRLRVYPKGFNDGDFSLNISSVQPSDAGLHRCFFNQETDDGEPRAIILNVQNSPSNNESQPSDNCSALLTTVIVGGVMIGIGIVGIICFGLYRKATSKTRKYNKKTLETRAPVQETEFLDVKMSSTQPFQ